MAHISTRDIKTRIRSMESTRQVTRAMETVAASKLRHAQARFNAARPYFEILRDTFDGIAESSRDLRSPYLMPRTGSRTLLIVIAGDRGMAGGYNSNVLKLAASLMDGREMTVLPIGRKALDHFRSMNVPLLTEAYAEAAKVDIGDCFTAAQSLSNAYLSGDFDEIHVVYTNCVSVLIQTAASLRLLPLVRERKEKKQGSRHFTVYEPNAGEVFASIVPEYLGGILYGVLSESLCAEQAARRTAMDSATSNAEEMISGLRQTYNRARQAAITQEITEIVAGVTG